MADYPLLILPAPAKYTRHKASGGPGDIAFPEPSQQRGRLGPKIDALEAAFRERRVVLQQQAPGAEPEQVLVLEVVGTIDEFYNAVKDVDGFEWLVEWEEDGIPAEAETFYDRRRPDSSLSGRLFLIMSNQRGMEELLRIWKTYRENPENPGFAHGRKKWKFLFAQLRDIRPWGPQDRIAETGLYAEWDERVKENAERVRVEVELWYRKNTFDRNRAVRLISEHVQSVNGTVVSEALRREIAYHAMLVELPLVAVEGLIQGDTQLVRAEEVMFFRPVGQAYVWLDVSEPLDDQLEVSAPTPALKEPVVALLDGLPIENHPALSDRLIVDDPDGIAESYTSQEQVHGTAMASLIARGDLDRAEPPLARPIYVRPILQPDPRDWNRDNRAEAISPDVLPVDLVYRSVRRLFEKTEDGVAVAPTVRVINLSVGDRHRPFARSVSPWARLLDYLAWRYKVLFIVSAGNHPTEIELDILTKDYPQLLSDPDARRSAIINALYKSAWNRRILSPSEAINVLTVGATHEDSSQEYEAGGRVDPVSQSGFPSPINAIGPGFGRSIKPEVLYPGGRQLYREKLGNTHEKAILWVDRSYRAPGVRVAAPGALLGELRSTRYIRGTSNAAALATRTAAQFYELLLDLRRTSEIELPDQNASVLLKAMLVHSARWGEAADIITKALQPETPEARRNLCSQLLGYGRAEPSRVFRCESTRCTLIGAGKIRAEAAHRYSIPLPAQLSGSTVWRRLTVTLAWLSPVNPAHRSYRQAALWFVPYGADRDDGDYEALLGLKRQDADHHAVRRGTIQHEIFEGEAAKIYEDGECLNIQVNCASDAGKFSDPIPYGLLVTLEVAPGVNIPIYEEVRARIQPRVDVRV